MVIENLNRARARARLTAAREAINIIVATERDEDIEVPRPIFPWSTFSLRSMYF